MELKRCPCCRGKASLIRDGSVFVGQTYLDRYPSGVAGQNHGYQVRCGRCGLQTCWWHYEKEARDNWNRRSQKEQPASSAVPINYVYKVLKESNYLDPLKLADIMEKFDPGLQSADKPEGGKCSHCAGDGESDEREGKKCRYCKGTGKQSADKPEGEKPKCSTCTNNNLGKGKCTDWPMCTVIYDKYEPNFSASG